MSISNERFDIPIQTNGTRRVSPTDLAQHERLNGCARFLRLRVYESNAGRGQMQQIMRRHGVQPQAPTPLPAVVGQQFETQFNRALAAQGWSIESLGSIDALHNLELIRMVRTIAHGETVFLLHANLEVTIYDWHLSGRPDLIRIHRQLDGHVEVLIADIKSAFAVKNEHQLQVALYHVMLESLFAPNECPTIVTGVVHQIPHQIHQDIAEQQRIQQLCDVAHSYFGVDNVCLDIIRNPMQLRDDALRLFMYDNDSPLQYATEQRIDQLPFAITPTCEGCGFMELCMAHVAQQRDLALVPYLDRDSRQVLRRNGVTTVSQLADLKLVNAERALVTSPATQQVVNQLGRDEQLGPHLDVLIARAQQIRSRQSDQNAPVAYLPLSTPITLPRIDASTNPDAVMMYVEVHHDHIGGAVWQLSALIERYLHGVSVATYPVVVVSDTVPTAELEAQILARWLGELAQVWQRHIGAPAPCQLVVYEAQTWQTLVSLLGRHYDSLPIARQWHDFVTTVQSIDGTQLVTVLHDEVKANNRVGTNVPSLMAVAGQIGFKWQDAHYDYRALLRLHHFDAVGKMPVTDEFYTARARFSSNIPLEYAYAAWQALPPPTAHNEDVFASYRHITHDVLRAYSTHRLLAIQHVAKRHGRWFNQRCAIVDIRTLATTYAAPTNLIGAMTEFMQFERMAEVTNWMRERELWPVDRVRAGSAFIVEFRDEWQDAPNRERVARLRHAALNNQPLPLQQVQWRVRVITAPDLPELAHQIGMSVLAGEQSEVVMSALTGSNGRVLTPRQLLHYAMRVKIVQRIPLDDGYELRLEMNESQTNSPYGFGGQTLVPMHGQRYVLDASPDNIPGSITNRALQNLAKEPYNNAMYRRLIGEQPAVRGLDANYMRAYVEACEALGGPIFAGDARRYVMEHHDTRLLLVQGPPGTGKTFTTAHAIMARIYAAMMTNRPLRIGVSCQTHAAVYAVMNNLAKVKEDLIRRQHPFADKLKELRLYRYRRNDEVYPASMVSVYMQKQPLVTDIHAHRWCVVGATPSSMESLGAAGDMWCDLLILDEASQMSLPQAVIAAQPLAHDGMVIVVGDPRQMPAIVSHAWEHEQRRLFVRYPVYRALFDYLLDGKTLLGAPVPMIKLDVSYRVPPRLADFLRHEIYQHDGINFRAAHDKHQMPPIAAQGFEAAVLHPDYPLILVEHDERDSRASNLFEADLVVRILRPLINAQYNATTGFGVVVPHRLQRSTIRELLRPHMPPNPQQMFGDVEVPGIDTVERYQGSERHIMIVSATESQRDYIQRNERFLFDMRRLNVALSRAQHKVIVIASREVLGYMARDVNMAQQSQMWKNYRHRWCTNEVNPVFTIKGHSVTVYRG